MINLNSSCPARILGKIYITRSPLQPMYKRVSYSVDRHILRKLSKTLRSWWQSFLQLSSQCQYLYLCCACRVTQGTGCLVAESDILCVRFPSLAAANPLAEMLNSYTSQATLSSYCRGYNG